MALALHFVFCSIWYASMCKPERCGSSRWEEWLEWSCRSTYVEWRTRNCKNVSFRFAGRACGTQGANVANDLEDSRYGGSGIFNEPPRVEVVSYIRPGE